MSPFARRTSAHPVDNGGRRGVACHNVGIFLQRARSGRGGSARASAEDRAVAVQGGLASLSHPSFRARDTLIWSDLSTAAEMKAETLFAFGPLDYKASLSNTALHRSWIWVERAFGQLAKADRLRDITNSSVDLGQASLAFPPVTAPTATAAAAIYWLRQP